MSASAINHAVYSMMLIVGMASASLFLDSSPADHGNDPCSNIGVKLTEKAYTYSDQPTTDCNNDGDNECGYTEYKWPAIFECNPGTPVPESCCKSFTKFSEKRSWSCNGAACVASQWQNDQAFTQATPLACTNGNQHADCTQ